MLTLPIKKKWFEMIRSGEKKEEYREIKPYYTTRFINLCELTDQNKKTFMSFLRKFGMSHENMFVMFRNGYSASSPSFVTKVSLSIGIGKEEWGAEPGKEYYVLRILEVRE